MSIGSYAFAWIHSISCCHVAYVAGRNIFWHVLLHVISCKKISESMVIYSFFLGWTFDTSRWQEVNSLVEKIVCRHTVDIYISAWEGKRVCENMYPSHLYNLANTFNIFVIYGFKGLYFHKTWTVPLYIDGRTCLLPFIKSLSIVSSASFRWVNARKT